MRVLNAEVILNKRVLVRLDLDIPLNNDGKPTDLTRLDAAIPTLQLLFHNARQIILCGHLGRPKGKLDPHLSVRQLVPAIEERLGFSVTVDDIYLAQANPVEPVAKCVLLENLRFYAGEEDNDEAFAKKLASLADIFIFEAFGVAHRESASTVGVTKHLPSYAGLHVAKETIELSTIIHSPLRPFVLVLGGAKIETKLPVIFHLEELADAILIGGVMANEVRDKQIKLPDNCILATMRADGLDTDKDSIDRFATILSKAQTIVWNGPVGKIEVEDSQWGTKQLAAAIVAPEAYTIVGGGDTVGILHTFGILDQFDFVSVGGGAMLAFLSGKPLPALQALE